MHTVSTSQAILMGSAIIGVGIYFGLSSMTSKTPSALSSNLQRPDISLPKQALPPAREKLVEQVNKAIAEIQTGLLKACPSMAKDAPDHFVIDFTFNAEGQQIARGFSEARSNTRPGLGACLSDAFPAITIPPPGVTVRVEAPFSYP